MELKEFIKETLKQIIEGVEEAQKYIVENKINAIIQPKEGWGTTPIGKINFDVAVTSTENSTTGMNGGINIAWAKFGGESKDETVEQNINRINFSISFMLPNQSNDNREIEKAGVVSRNKKSNPTL